MTAVVVDASAIVEYLLRTPRGRSYEARMEDPAVELSVPALCDVEVAAALRRGLLSGRLSERRCGEALDDYLDLPLGRHPHVDVLMRVLQLRANMSAYDATYVALAEKLNASLLTADDALGRAVRDRVDVDVIG